MNRVITPDFGQALPLWFPFTIKYWFPNYVHNQTNYATKLSDVTASSPRNYHNQTIPTEHVSETLKSQARQGKSIEIKNLRKDYGDTIAVNGLNLSMYSGQITALLGHNGAGKTTTINMLTGATAPTSGCATVAGKDIRTEMSEIRQDIGICLQHDCLFPNLTVREHIQFFARLKGLYSKVSVDEAEEQVDQALVDVALSEKRNTLSRYLSGGMKRKLSVAVAFCGGSKVVLLDEPTSGMDPFSRRFTWDVIRHYKKDRIIILTTHFMDEADILGDRIAIMAEGQLRCVGSSLFLKKVYGVGYQLTIDLGQSETIRCSDLHEQSPALASSVITNSRYQQYSTGEINKEEELNRIVKDSVRDAVLLSKIGSEITFQLPFTATSSFASMFKELDELVESRNINCYGVSVTTLNEVFLMVARGEKPVALTSDSSTDSDDLDSFETEPENCETSSDESDQDQYSTNELFKLRDFGNERYFRRHVIALMTKRGLNFRRDRKAWICTTIVPSVFVFVGFLIVALTAPELHMPPLVLDPSAYNSDIGLNQIAFNNPDNPFTCQPGLCSHRQPYNENEEMNEAYTFCGYQAKLGISKKGFSPTNQTCTVADSSSVMSAIETRNIIASEADITSVEEVCIICVPGNIHFVDISHFLEFSFNLGVEHVEQHQKSTSIFNIRCNMVLPLSR
jgi:ABC-type multidrug transport system ATPase subunit